LKEKREENTKKEREVSKKMLDVKEEKKIEEVKKEEIINEEIGFVDKVKKLIREIVDLVLHLLLSKLIELAMMVLPPSLSKYIVSEKKSN
jgi:CRISPR/Cas system-associated endonuclease Cas3-HD